jgi:fatty-acyl-CoA synthase
LGLQPTPTENNQPMRAADFPNLAAALDYAAQGQTGGNFYNSRGELYAVLTYAELRLQALQLAQRLCGLNVERGARVAIIAETDPDFLRFFFACQYAGLVPQGVCKTYPGDGAKLSGLAGGSAGGLLRTAG